MSKTRLLIFLFFITSSYGSGQIFEGVVIYKTSPTNKEGCQQLIDPPPEFDTVFFSDNRSFHKIGSSGFSPITMYNVYDYKTNTKYTYYEFQGESSLLIQNEEILQATEDSLISELKVDTLSDNRFQLHYKYDTVEIEFTQKYNIPFYPDYLSFNGIPTKYTLVLPRVFCNYEYELYDVKARKIKHRNFYPEKKEVNNRYYNIPHKDFMYKLMH